MRTCLRACVVRAYCVRICACREEAAGRSEWEDERQCRWARGIRREVEEESERNRERGRERGVALRLVHARTPTSGTHVTRPDRYALPKSPSLSVSLSPSLSLSLLCSLSFLSLFLSFSLSLLLGFFFSISIPRILFTGFLYHTSPSNPFLLLSCCIQAARFPLCLTTVRILYSFLSRNLAHSSHARE